VIEAKMAPMQSQNKQKSVDFEPGLSSAETVVSRRTADPRLPDLLQAVEQWKRKAHNAELIRDEWCQQNKELRDRFITARAELETVEAELALIHSSPGWQALEAYRGWLRRHNETDVWVRALFSPAMAWILKVAGLGNRELASRGTRAKSVQPQRAHQTPSEAPAHELAPFAAPSATGATYAEWLSATSPTPSQLEAQREIGRCFTYRPTISVITPVYKISSAILRETVNSVLAQTYENWELCISHSNPDDRQQRRWLLEVAASDPRIKVELLPTNEGISENSNRALKLATGEFAALLDHDDALSVNALFEIADLLNQDSTINFIYSDKDQIAENSAERVAPLFKPAWSPDVMLSANYLTHLCVMRTRHIRELGGWNKQTDGAQDWDLFLRIARQFGNVRHLPKVLYHWRRVGSSVSVGGLAVKPYVTAGQVRAVGDHCRESKLPASVSFGDRELRVSWVMERRVSVTLVSIGSRGTSELATFARDANFPDLDIRTVRAGEGLVDRIESCVRSSSAELIVFVDSEVLPAVTGWLTELAGPLQNAEIGVSGAMLIDPETKLLKHCGIVFTEDGIAEAIYAGFPGYVNEVFGPASWYRNWSAVSGACFAIRRDVWERAFALRDNPLHPRLDLHICLTATRQMGKRVLYTPYAQFYQKQPALLEYPVWGDPSAGQASIRAAFPNGDPFFHSQLWCKDGSVGFKVPAKDVVESPKVIDYAAESRVLSHIFDFSPSLVERSKLICSNSTARELKSVTWFIPEIDNPFYGGAHTILRFAEWFRRNRGIRSTFCVIGHGSPERFRSLFGMAFPDLAAESEFFVMGHKDVNRLPASDAAICTLWTTAYAALHFTHARKKFYFIQDDEALFYPAGSTAALVESTYGFGFRGICNTVSLLNRYRECGGDGEYFTPAIDPAVFHARGRRSGENGTYNLFCYGRPGHARNSFELLGAVLTEVKRRFGNDIRIYNAGADWNPKAYGLENVAENLGTLSYHSTGALYRACDAGLVIMMTRHPSYLPMELMACGALVVTNRNRDTGWLLKDRQNCLLAEPGVTAIADQVEQGLRNSRLRTGIVERASAQVAEQFTDWDSQIEKIHRFMLS
jgi:glycosyltransferase involved in cell wall biosynthesis